MNEKVAQVLQKGKEICGKCKAQVFQGYAMGNELMDKVGFLQKPLHKKIVWGAIGAIVIVSLFLLFNGGDSPESALARLAAALDEKDWIKMQGCVYGSNPTKAGRSMNAEEMKEFATSEFVKSQMESDSMKEFANTIRDAKILSVKIKDDRATMKFRPGDQETLKRMRADGATGVKIEAVKSDGVWKINMDSFDVIMK